MFLKKHLSTLMSIVLIMFSTLFGTSPISADAGNEEGADFLNQVEDQLKDSNHIIDKNAIQDYTERSMTAVGKDIYIEEESLNTEQATLVEYIDPETKEILFINNIPVLKDDSHELSNVAIVYDEKGNLTQYTELYLTKNKHGNFNVNSYIDGEEVLNEDTDEKFMSAGEYAEYIKDNPKLNVDISLLAKCLSISIGLAEVIAAGCIGVCAITAGAGCVACVAGLAGFAVGGNSACVISAFQ